MRQDLIRSSLTEYGVIPKASPIQTQSIAVDKETPQVIYHSEGELSEQEGSDLGTCKQDQLMLTAEEQMDYDSFALASPSVTRAPLWKFNEETPSGSQTLTQSQTITILAQPVTSTPAKPSGSWTRAQAPAQAWPQAPAEAQPQAPAQAQPPRTSQAYLPQPQAAVPLGVRRVPSDSR